MLGSVLDLNAFERQNKAEGLGMVSEEGTSEYDLWRHNQTCQCVSVVCGPLYAYFCLSMCLFVDVGLQVCLDSRNGDDLVLFRAFWLLTVLYVCRWLVYHPLTAMRFPVSLCLSLSFSLLHLPYFVRFNPLLLTPVHEFAGSQIRS